jgi:hypothetical protein
LLASNIGVFWSNSELAVVTSDAPSAQHTRAVVTIRTARVTQCARVTKGTGGPRAGVVVTGVVEMGGAALTSEYYGRLAKSWSVLVHVEHTSPVHQVDYAVEVDNSGEFTVSLLVPCKWLGEGPYVWRLHAVCAHSRLLRLPRNNDPWIDTPKVRGADGVSLLIGEVASFGARGSSIVIIDGSKSAVFVSSLTFLSRCFETEIRTLKAEIRRKLKLSYTVPDEAVAIIVSFVAGVQPHQKPTAHWRRCSLGNLTRNQTEGMEICARYLDGRKARCDIPIFTELPLQGVFVTESQLADWRENSSEFGKHHEGMDVPVMSHAGRGYYVMSRDYSSRMWLQLVQDLTVTGAYNARGDPLLVEPQPGSNNSEFRMLRVDDNQRPFPAAIRVTSEIPQGSVLGVAYPVLHWLRRNMRTAESRGRPMVVPAVDSDVQVTAFHLPGGFVVGVARLVNLTALQHAAITDAVAGLWAERSQRADATLTSALGGQSALFPATSAINLSMTVHGLKVDTHRFDLGLDSECTSSVRVMFGLKNTSVSFIGAQDDAPCADADVTFHTNLPMC